MNLRLASPAEFDHLRKFRERIFAAELGIQESTYQDVFNDHFSKNIVLEQAGELVGVARLAFSRESQDFFFSYVALVPGRRSRGALRLLLGALFILMKANDIRVVRADSADENLPMYRAAGCRIVGPRFRKFGFRCEWTPLVYVLGTHPRSEARLMRQAQSCLRRGTLRRWKFPIQLVLCTSLKDYKDVLNRLAASREIMGTVPHFMSAAPSRPVVISDRLPPARIVSAKSLKKASRQFHFADLNRCLNAEHRIVVTQDSPFCEIAQTYACLTRKSVEFRKRNELFSDALSQAKSCLFVLTREELAVLLQSSLIGSQDCHLGVVTGNDEEEVSRLLLRNYFEFLALVNGVHPLQVTFLQAESLSYIPKWRSSHTVICHPDTPEAAISFLQCLLQYGYSVGEAVSCANLSFADRLTRPMLLAGDPCLRYAPFRPLDMPGTNALLTRMPRGTDNGVTTLNQLPRGVPEKTSRRGTPDKHNSVEGSGVLHPLCSNGIGNVHRKFSSKQRLD